MRLLDNAVLRESYDVIVIGSGLGGLTAAALIAKRGPRTLLVEHHYLPGGMCTTLRRQGFSFDTGTALIYGFGERGVNPHRFVMNELDADIDVIEHQALLRMRLPDRQITFWPDYERFVEELVSAFPAQANQIRPLYGYLHKVYSDVIARNQMITPPTEIPLVENLKTLLRHPIVMLQTLRMLSTSTESVLKRYIKDPGLMAFFDKLVSTYVYCTTAEAPAILAATMFIDNHVGGAYYPARSPQVLASTLEMAFEQAGGETLYGHRVDEIVLEGDTAVGVRLANGIELRSSHVVANVTVWNLYGRLIRPEHIKPERLTWAQSLIPTYPSMVLYIGVDAEAIPAGTMPVEMLVADTDGVNAGDVTMYISSLDDPSIAPHGMHAITVIAPSLDKWPRPWDPDYRSAAYEEHKQAATERILHQIEGHFPGFRGHIRVMEAGTPTTIERYTLKNGGAVGGPKQKIGQQLMKRLHARSEWQNLYICGDSTVMGMGAPAVTVSGVGAANLLLRDMKLPEYQRRPFDREAVHLVRGQPLPPLPDIAEPIDRKKAMRLARECEYCEHPGCSSACPTGIDVRNVMRRIEADNVTGAARLLRETNPLAEVCGHLCGPNSPCELACNRHVYSERSVRIADLQAWVCREAGTAGWPLPATSVTGPKVAIVGAGPAGLSCAYYLARIGYSVTLMDRHGKPGGALLASDPAVLPTDAMLRDIGGALTPGVEFVGGFALDMDSVASLAEAHAAILLATGTESGINLREIGLEQDQGGTCWRGKVVLAGGAVLGPCSVVQAVASGRRAASAIERMLAGESGRARQ